MSRNVLGAMASTWAAVWDEVIAIQSRNPDTRRVAESKTTDAKLAIVEIQPTLALLHPAIVRSVAAFCHGVADEFGFDGDEAVTGRAYPHCVGDEHAFGGGGQQQDRAVDDRLAAIEARQEVIDDLLAEVLSRLDGPGGDPGSRGAAPPAGPGAAR